MEMLSPVMLGFLGSLVAGLMKTVGAAPASFGRVPDRAFRDLALGFAAGVMLSASFFSLIIPSLETAEMRYGGTFVPPRSLARRS